MICQDCGEREARYHRDGERCASCWRRWRRQTNPEAAAHERAVSLRWKHEHLERRRQGDRDYALRRRHPCATCGEPCQRSATLCESCKADEAHARRSRLAEMWRAGESLASIAAALDSTTNAIGTTMAHMRRDGWDLPYRRADKRAA